MAYPLQQNLQPQPYWYRRLVISSLLMITICLSAWLAQAQRPNNSDILLGNDQRMYLRTVERLFTHADQRIWIMMYVARLYKQPQHSINALCQLLADAVQRGVDVHVVLDRSDPTAKYHGPDNQEIANWLEAHQILVTFDEIARTTHAKIVLVDDQVIIGSHNWTGYAVSKNRELSVLTEDPDVIRDIELAFHDVPGFDYEPDNELDKKLIEN